MPDDQRYLSLILEPIRICRNYRPKFGHEAGYNLKRFKELYRADPFYAWFGLDSPLLYTAHRAAGGMTSLYRQIGIGCQRLFQQLLIDQLGLSAEQASWFYLSEAGTGKPRRLSLDARIELGAITQPKARNRVVRWLQAAANELGVDPGIQSILKGSVFEVRQGYKSKDSKRQQADLANASAAYASAYLPAVLLLSNQIDDDIAERYQSARWLILRGLTEGSATNLTYAFCRDVVGYDLAAFFERNSRRIKAEVESVLRELLK
ncbi:MAG: hypothetical protein RMK99_00675 [Anaerolineales bacterium]|nr:hypothetical protein [Anaerolineales bacterium]